MIKGKEVKTFQLINQESPKSKCFKNCSNNIKENVQIG